MAAFVRERKECGYGMKWTNSKAVAPEVNNCRRLRSDICILKETGVT